MRSRKQGVGWAARLLVGVGVLLGVSGGVRAQNVVREVSYTYDAVTGQVTSERVDPNGAGCVETKTTYDPYGNKSTVLVQYCGADSAYAFDSRMTVNQYNSQGAQAASGGMPALPAAPAGAFLTQSQSGQPNAGNTGLAVIMSQTSAVYHPANGTALRQTANALANASFDLTSKAEVDGLGRVWKTYTPVARSGGALSYTSTEQRRVYCLGPLAAQTSGTDKAICLNFSQQIPTQYASGLLFDASGNSVPSAYASAITAYYIETVPKDTGGTVMGGRSRVHYDSLGREIAKEAETYALQWTMSLTVFDRLGIAAASWSGFFGRDAAGTFIAPPEELKQWTTARDLVHRPTENAGYWRGADGGMATASYSHITYHGLQGTSTVPSPDGVDRATTAIKYGNGQVAQTIDAYGATLTNAYDAVGNLVKTVDALNNVSTIGYTLGTARFKVSMQDPNQGPWTYEYNALGQLVKQTDGRGKITGLSYDRLGRLKTKTSDDLNSYWYYDTNRAGVSCAYGLNRLCETYAGKPVNPANPASVENKVTGKVVLYDDMARGTEAQTWLANRVFSTRTNYDGLGRPYKLTYPTGFAVQYGYSAGGAGRLAGVMDRVFDDAVQTRHFWRIDTIADPKTVFDAKGNLLKADIGRNTGASSGWVSSGNSFDPISSHPLLLGATTAASSSANVLSHTYTFDIAGNVVTRTENENGITETFQHDRLNRLTSDTVASSTDATAARTVTVQYNAIGNILYKSDVGGYAYNTSGAIRPHAVNSAGGTNYAYDGNGNLFSASGVQVRTNTWTSFNQPDSMSYQGRSDTFLYDESYQRIQEVITNGSTVRTVHKIHPDNQGGLSFEREITTVGGAITRNENRHYITVGGAVIGVVKTLTPAANDPVAGPVNGTISTAAADANLVNYWHKDALGSVVAVSDRDGNVLERMAYDPWGRRVTDKGKADSTVDPANGDRGFTGHEHLDELAYVHMNGRIYDPLLGRFLSPDPMIGNPSDLQNFNRYSYVNNSPLKFTDPSGYCIWDYCVAEIAAVIVGYEMTQQGNEYWRMAGTLLMMWGGQGLIDQGMGEFGGTGFGGNSNFLEIGQANTFNTGGLGNSFLAASASTLAAGGSPEQALTAGVFGTLFTGAGAAFANESGKLIAVHMLLGCVQGEATGGNCGPSAMAAGFSKATTIGLSNSGLNPAALGVLTTIAGGTASAIGGGKFSNGAFQAGFGYLFNCLTSFECFKHYREGSGTASPARFSDLGADDVQAQDFKGFRNLLTFHAEEGVYEVDTVKGHQTKSADAKLAYGRVTLNLKGLLTVRNGGEWAFSGEIVAKPDFYDFDKSNRGFVAETLTTIGRNINGVPFSIPFEGGRKIEQTGKLPGW